MRIAVVKETAPGETRVAASPETVKKFIALGASVAVQPGAGEAASCIGETVTRGEKRATAPGQSSPCGPKDHRGGFF